MLAVGRSYREAMREFAAMSNLDVWYSRLTVEEIVARLRQAKAKKQAKAVAAGAREGADEGQHEGLQQADDRRRRRAAGSSPTRR